MGLIANGNGYCVSQFKQMEMLCSFKYLTWGCFWGSELLQNITSLGIYKGKFCWSKISWFHHQTQLLAFTMNVFLYTWFCCNVLKSLQNLSLLSSSVIPHKTTSNSTTRHPVHPFVTLEFICYSALQNFWVTLPISNFKSDNSMTLVL